MGKILTQLNPRQDLTSKPLSIESEYDMREDHQKFFVYLASVKSKLQHPPALPYLGIPRALNTFSFCGGGNLIIIIFIGVGNLITMLRVGAFEPQLQFHMIHVCMSWSWYGDKGGLDDFKGKGCGFMVYWHKTHKLCNFPSRVGHLITLN